MLHSTEVGPSLHGGIHQLRRTHAGIRYLKQTGQFRDYMQAYVDTKNRPFLAWDGEGWTDTNLEHRYMLLQNSTGAYIDAPQLRTRECLNMILDTAARHPKHIHVGYGFGYDTTQILWDLTDEQRDGLKDNGEVVYTVPYNPTTGEQRNTYTLHYLPHKWFQIRGYDWNSHKWVTVKIFDVMTFFQSSFINALDSRNIPIPDVIRTGKAARADFQYSDIVEVREYCQQELEMTVMLCNQLRTEFDDAGMWVTQWHGPGAVASTIYKQFGVRNHMQPPTPHIERAAQHAYFGGHFEQYKAGHYNGTVYLYDINSAYPYHIANLPTLSGAEWEHTTRYDPTQMGVWRVTYNHPSNDHKSAHPFPWRGAGGEVGFPTHNVDVWVWGPEAANATQVLEGYILHSASDVKPFDFVPDMYATRKRWQDEQRGGERALKLALNSLYGKMAQRVGGNPRYDNRPPWHQLEWAGMVTSGTRAQIWDALKLNPASVIAVETDSIMTTEPLDLDIGTGLGQWGLTTYEWVTYLQSGIYFTSNGVGKAKSKTRGIDATKLHYPEVMHYLAGDQSEPLLVEAQLFIGIGNPRSTSMYGQWQNYTKEVRVAGQKRIHAPAYCDACKESRGSMAETLHDLIAAPHYGQVPSAAHHLPWINGGVTEEPEMNYIGDAVADWERRHV